jgi:hypothetical protein
MGLSAGFAKSSPAQLKIALGGAFISRIQDTISRLQRNPDYSRSARLPKDVVIHTRGCRLGDGDLAVMRRAAEIAIGQAADSVAAQIGLSRDRLIQTLWPAADCINVTLSYNPPNGFGFDLDLDE